MQKQTIALAAVLVSAALAATAAVASATAPGKNGDIAFRRYFDQAHESWGAVFTINPNGQNERQVTRPPEGTVDDQPDWSPDGSRIVFERCGDGCRVATVRPEGSDLQYLTPQCSDAPDAECLDIRGPAYSPDGSKIAFAWITGPDKVFPDGTDQAKGMALDIMNADGSGRRDVFKLGPYVADLNYPQFSPDGGQLVFAQVNSQLGKPSHGRAVFVIGVDGKGLKRITPWSLTAGDNADWSPDGTLIAFRSNVEESAKQSQIYVVHPDGTGRKQLTHFKPGTLVLSSAFSPDGQWIVFATTGKGGNADVAIMRADGTGMRHVTRGARFESAPDWGLLAG